jgi:protein-S-isoprenylcysteine O-methyltransferase
VTAGIIVSERFPAAWMSRGLADLWLSLALFTCGLALRWYSIRYLGRYFTVSVAIHSGHEIIDTGPYRHIRHPSYTGALLAFLGIAVGLNNWVALPLMMIPITWAFLRRIRIEERALANALGKPYTSYMGRTKKLVPFIY